jgi:hypothetical protein
LVAVDKFAEGHILVEEDMPVVGILVVGILVGGILVAGSFVVGTQILDMLAALNPFERII